MYDNAPHAILFSALLVAATALMPATALAGDDVTSDRQADEARAEETADKQAVTIDEMTTEEADDSDQQAARETTLQQEEGAAETTLARTIGLNALWGGLTGGVVGLGFYLLTGMETTPWVIAQFAGGGILIGGAVGLITGLADAEAAASEPPTTAYEEDDRPNSVDYVRQRSPETFEMPILEGRF